MYRRILSKLVVIIVLLSLIIPQIALGQQLTGQQIQIKNCIAAPSYGEMFECSIQSIIEAVSQLMLFILHAVTLLIQPLLTGPNFITNPLVQAGWPFVLGIANLGFVLALLFIALLTIMGLGGYNVRRALVRLLIAAVLINFSLLIAGVILDVSRLLMALILNLVGNINPSHGLGLSLLKASNVFNTAFKFVFDTRVGEAHFALDYRVSIFQSLKAMWLIGGTTIIFVILAISLLARWLILIFLLILSPLAFLAMATPGLYNRSEQWWKLFLTYVLYGPVVAFILAIAVKGGNLAGEYITRLAVADPKDDTFGLQSLVTLAMTLGLMFLSTQAGKFLGLSGALTMTGFIKNQVGGALGFARRHPFLVGGAIAGPVGLAAVGGAKVGTTTAKYGWGAIKKGAKQATIGVIDEAVAARTGKALKAYQKVAAGTATKEDYKELKKSPFWRTVASVVTKIPGAGGRAGIGSKLDERDQRQQEAMNVVDEAGRREAAGDIAGAQNLVQNAPELQGLRFAEVDDEFTLDQTKRVLRLANPKQKKQMLQEPAVIKKLLEDTTPGGGYEMILRLKDETQTPVESVKGISNDEVKIDLENKIRAANPRWNDARVQAQIRVDLPARIKFTRESVADENQRRQLNKQIVDALNKGENELYKKEFGT